MKDRKRRKEPPSSVLAEIASERSAMLALLFGCGFRRSELVGLELDEIQMRQGHWAVVDLIGKGGHIRTVPIPAWVRATRLLRGYLETCGQHQCCDQYAFTASYPVTSAVLLELARAEFPIVHSP